MKRMLSILMAVSLLFCFTACGGQEPVEEVTFIPGVSSGNVYESEFLGVRLELPSNFTFYTQEEIAELNGVVTDVLGDEYTAAIANNQLIYDMYAGDNSGSSININFENLSVAGVSIADANAYVELTKDSIPTALESMGYTVTSCETATVTIAGQQHAAVDVVATIGSFEFYETIACIKKGNYVSCITVGGFDESSIDEIFGRFTAL